MRASLPIPAGTIFGFLMVLVRMVGAFIFVPLPTTQAGPGVVRIVVALACAMALYPAWPVGMSLPDTTGQMFLWLISEVALGVGIGLAVACISEALMLGAQMLSVQAGYGYASMVDPVSEADSAVLPVIAQLTAGLLFFATGLDRQVLHAFALSLQANPPGKFAITQTVATTLIHTAGGIFTVGLRLALPVVGLLLTTDISLALLGRVNSQLHLVTLAMPAKMLVGLAALSSVLLVFPSVYQSFAAQAFTVVRGILSGR